MPISAAPVRTLTGHWSRPSPRSEQLGAPQDHHLQQRATHHERDWIGPTIHPAPPGPGEQHHAERLDVCAAAVAAGSGIARGPILSPVIDQVVRAVCLRHAESANVIAGASGSLPAAPLTPRGREQAVVAAHALMPHPIVRLYASTAVRAREAARVIADMLDIEVRLMSELTEVGIGRLEGATDPAPS